MANPPEWLTSLEAEVNRVLNSCFVAFFQIKPASGLISKKCSGVFFVFGSKN